SLEFLLDGGIDGAQAVDFLQVSNHGKHDIEVDSCFYARMQERTELLAQEFFMHEVNTRSTQSKGRVGFLQGTNQWFKGGKGFVGTRIECARNDSFSEQRM